MRKDRQVNSDSEIAQILNDCDTVSVAFVDENNNPYIIPMNFGLYENNGKYTLYFHSGLKGKKIKLLEKEPIVAFSAYCHLKLITDEIACRTTMKFKSVCGTGKAVFLDDTEKNIAMANIMRHYIGEEKYILDERMFKVVQFWKIEVENWSGKSNYKGE